MVMGTSECCGRHRGESGSRVMFIFLTDDFPPSGSGLGTAAGSVIILYAPLDAPIKDTIILVSLANEQVPEQLAQVQVVGFIIEAERTSIVQEDAELIGEATAEEIRGSRHLLFHYTVVLLLFGGHLEALPGKGTTKEIHQDVSEGFYIISACLLDTQMGVDGHVVGGPSQLSGFMSR
jgi:hypothetical protein